MISFVKTLSKTLVIILLLNFGKILKSQDAVTVNFEDGISSLVSGNIPKAKVCFEQELEKIKIKWGMKNKYYAHGLNYLGKSFQLNKELIQAESRYLDALKIFRDLNADPKEYLDLQYNLAQLNYEFGRYLKAKDILKNILPLLDKKSENYNYVKILFANINREVGNSNTADSIWSDLKTSVSIESPINYADYLGNEAIELYNNGYLEKAAQKFLEAAEIIKNNYDEHYPAYASFLNNVASIYKELNRYEEAKSIYLTTLELKSKLGKNNPSYSITLSNLAKLCAEANQLDEAEKYYLDLNRNIINQVKIYFPILSEKEQEDFWFRIKKDFNSFCSFVSIRRQDNSEIINDLIQFRLFTKALLFRTVQQIKTSVKSSQNIYLKEKYESLKNIRTELSKLFSIEKPAGKEINNKIDSLNFELNILDKELNRLTSKILENTEYLKVTQYNDLTDVLLGNEAAIEIIRYSDQNETVNYVAIIIYGDKKRKVKWVSIPNGTDLETKYLKNYQRRINGKTEDLFSFKVYWSFIGNELDGIDKIYLSADGVYNQINVGSLNSSDKQYVADHLGIINITNLTDVLNIKENVISEITFETAVLVGAPNFELKDNKLQISKKKQKGESQNDKRHVNFFNSITELPGTRIEIENIRDILQRNNVKMTKFIGDYANKHNLQSIESPNILHIATHGFFLENGNRTVTASGISGTAKDENPLLRSGLLLAGVKNRFDEFENQNYGNGILTAFETKEMNLNDTKLVVLSACETGRGEIQIGEGVYGLQRAFQIAGASSVLMSLWQVDDTVTQELMILFYQNLFKLKNIRKAFAESQNQIKIKYSHPYYWGAFILVSNTW